jgi:hypothetical protein
MQYSALRSKCASLGAHRVREMRPKGCTPTVQLAVVFSREGKDTKVTSQCNFLAAWSLRHILAMCNHTYCYASVWLLHRRNVS